MEPKTRKRVRTKTIPRFITQSQIWKRLTQAPAPAPAPPKDNRSQEMMARLQARESQGDGDLGYCDGAGCC
jgi:hypothetical protein